MRFRRRLRELAGWLLLAAIARGAMAQTSGGADGAMLAQFARGAERVFRGRCLSAEPVTVALPGGGAVEATRYVFTVAEPLKGLTRAGRTAFVQVGRPGGGEDDLGYRVGLPTYEPGAEYVLFLLPESKRGLTSPAGAGEGALRVEGGRSYWLHGGHGLTARALAGAASRNADDKRGLPIDLDVLRGIVRGAL